VAMNTWLEPELQRGLREVSAPQELWSRVLSGHNPGTQTSSRALVWAMAAIVIVAAVALSKLPTRRVNIAAYNDSQQVGFQCQNPAKSRAWVAARTAVATVSTTSSAVTAGQPFTLASNNSTSLQLACKLCHLD
jgi:hypothetical protein